jgi:cell division protein ZapA
MMNRGASVELRVGGQTYRVASSATDDELLRLAGIVDTKLRQLGGSTAFHPQSMLLVAISLAHELEEERARRKHVEARSREMLQHLLERVDSALELTDDGEADASPASPP